MVAPAAAAEATVVDAPSSGLWKIPCLESIASSWFTSCPKSRPCPLPREILSPWQNDDNTVAMYIQDFKEKHEEVLVPFKKLCKTKEIETLILDDDDSAKALLRYSSESGISCLVLGSCSSNFLTMKLKGPGVPESVLICSANTCDIYVVLSNQRVITKAANPSSSWETRSGHQSSAQRDHRQRLHGFGEQISGFRSLLVESQVNKPFGVSTMSVLSYQNSEALTQMGSPTNTNIHQDLAADLETHTLRQCNSMASLKTDKKLRLNSCVKNCKVLLQCIIELVTNWSMHQRRSS